MHGLLRSILCVSTTCLLFACSEEAPSDDEDFDGEDSELSVSEQSSLPPRPSSIASVTSEAGPQVGEVTIHWKHDGKNTSGYVLETGLTTFSKTNDALPESGRHPRFFNIGKRARSITLSSRQVAEAGADVASGNNLYFRLAAVNEGTTGKSVRYFPSLRAVLPRPKAPSGGLMHVASFNVRTARATTDKRKWLERAPDVAEQIVQHAPGLVALQECGPGRADGKVGSLDGTPRQTDSLMTALHAAQGDRYRMVRTTPYAEPGTPTGTQGMRILYDSTKYRLVSDCPEETNGRKYSASCSIVLPVLSTDGQDRTRRAAYAKFLDVATQKTFWFLSIHLDERHSDNHGVERNYDDLRRRQVETFSTALDALNVDGLPVVIAGDFNSWQNNQVGNSPHDALIGRGYYDASAAVIRKNFKYPTINHFDETLKPNSLGIGVRIDMIFVKGSPGSAYFENVMKVTDLARPSDHNMIVAHVAPFGAL